MFRLSTNFQLHQINYDLSFLIIEHSERVATVMQSTAGRAGSLMQVMDAETYKHSESFLLILLNDFGHFLCLRFLLTLLIPLKKCAACCFNYGPSLPIIYLG